MSWVHLFAKSENLTFCHLLYQLHTSVQFLPIAPLVLEGGPRQFLVIFRAFHKLWEVVLARPVKIFLQALRQIIKERTCKRK